MNNQKGFARKLHIILLVFLIFSLFTFSQTPNAFACQCLRSPVGTTPTRSRLLGNSEAVFAGKVTNIKYLDPLKDVNELKPGDVSEPRIIVTFDISQLWKGPNQKSIVLHTVHNRYSCNGYFFENGKEYLVYASKNEDGTLGTSLCGGTSELAQAGKDISVLGKGTLPKTEIPKSESSNFSSKVMVGFISILIIGIIYKLFVLNRKAAKD